MKKIIAILICALVLSVSLTSAQTRLCFENQGLKEISRISFELKGNKIVEGYFETIGYDADTSAQAFEFTGIKSGNQLTIKFARAIPYERPPKAKTIVWTLGKNVVRVPTYGKDYRTNKFEAYTAEYEPCDAN